MSDQVTIKIQKLPGNEDLPLPSRMSEGASGFDLYAALKESVILQPGERTLIPAGFKMAMPVNMEAQVRPRSGLALKKGITCLNSPGTIDADYRGEVGVILINHSNEHFEIQRGDRIAQMIFQYVPVVTLQEVDELQETRRGDGGFGHTGV